jgi:serine phosphatase RsbU (regulator of sigma subunit)
MKKHTVFLIFMLLYCSSLFGQSTVVVLSKEKKTYKIGKSVSFYLDSTRKETLDDILLLDDSKFEQSKTDIPNWGFNSTNIWIKINLKNTTQEISDWYLNLDSPTLSRADFYFQDSLSQWKTINSGNRVPASQRNFKNRSFVFPLDFSANQSATFYLKLSNAGPIQAPLIIENLSDFYARQMLFEAYYGILTGIFLLVLVINFFFWINLKDSTYFYYIIYTLGSMFALLYMSGHVMLYVLGDFPKLSGVAIISFLSLIVIGLPLFSKMFLSIKRKLLYYTLYTIAICGLFILFYTIIIGYSTVFLLITLLLLSFSTLLVFVIGVISLYLGKREARFFVLAFGVYFIGMFVLILRLLGLIPISLFTNHVLELASVIEIIIISLALSDRHNIERKKMQADALKLEIEAQSNLELKVTERTRELVQTNKLLHFKNKQIDSSIAAAEHIQKAMLPYVGKIKNIVSPYFIIYRPKDVVSGDFYWLNQIDHQKIIAIVDCTGHGVPGAFMSLIGKKLLDEIVKIGGITDPAEILTHLHQQVRKTLRQDYTDNDYGMDMAIINIQTQEHQHKITFSGAKNSMYYIQEKQEELIELKGTRKGIGGRQNESKEFTNQSVFLDENTTIYMGTDGFQDQHNTEGKKLGSIRLKEILVENSKLSLEEQKNKLEHIIDERLTEVNQRDDILLFACKL